MMSPGTRKLLCNAIVDGSRHPFQRNQYRYSFAPRNPQSPKKPHISNITGLESSLSQQ